MSEERRDRENDRWRAEYRAMMKSLPRGEPDPGLEERTVQRLQSAQVLQRGPRRWRWQASLAAAAAAVLLFAGGVVVGRVTTSAAPQPAVTGETAPMELQRAASAYLAALQALQDTSVTERGRQTGVEIGVNTLESAASELVRAAPNDPLAGEIARAIHVSRTRERALQSGRGRNIVWF